MGLAEVKHILEKHSILYDGLPIQLNKRILSVTARVYRAIEKKEKEGDILAQGEHLALFDYFWEMGNRERGSNAHLTEELKLKLLERRREISRFDMLAAGHIEGGNLPSIIRQGGLSDLEAAQLWAIFHQLWPRAATRDCNKINDILGLFAIVNDKLRWRFRKIRVLDLGCGKNGNGISTLALRYPKLDGYGIDLNLDKEHPSNVNLVRANLKNLPFPENFFDIVYSCEVIYYLEEKELLETIKEIFRVLKRNGIFLFNSTKSLDYYSNALHKLPSEISSRFSAYGHPRSILMLKK